MHSSADSISTIGAETTRRLPIDKPPQNRQFGIDGPTVHAYTDFRMINLAKQCVVKQADAKRHSMWRPRAAVILCAFSGGGLIR